MMKLKAAALLLIVLISISYALVPGYELDNPALSLESKREFLDMNFNMKMNIFQNLLTVNDFFKLLEGSTVTIDESKYELISDSLTIQPGLNVPVYLNLGTKNWKLGFFTNVENAIALSIPKEIAGIFLGQMEMDQNINEEFNLFNGGLFIKSGILFAMRFGDFGAGINFGGYAPIAWFDEDSKVNFKYESDSDTGQLLVSLNGDARLYTALGNFDDIDTDSIIQNMGYFVDIGGFWKSGQFLVAGAIQNIPITSANMPYEAYVNVSFEASLVNLTFGMQGPELQLPETVVEAATPGEVKIPMKISFLTAYDTGFFGVSLAVHGSYVTGLGAFNIGGFVSLADILWMDISYISSGYWKKSLGLNLDLRLLKLSMVAGVYDTGLLNFDTSKMTGVSFGFSMGMGF